ncbi:MAG TPA: zf-HC2 domain-containing protein [Blastocatellia bacterium]|nr:zf-HC2 domain-containing protein [Blastocatellia bacterium]
MKQCDGIRTRIAFYLDDELRNGELAGFEEHLKSCKPCANLVAGERRFLEFVRQSRPLYSAPPELRARAEEVVSVTAAPDSAPAELRRRVQDSITRATHGTFHVNTRRGAFALAAAITVVILAGLWITSGREPKPNPPSEFAMMAVDTHVRHLRGQLPFEIASSSPEAISGWFAGKVPFGVKLPTYQESSGQDKLYSLEGARLVGFKNDYAAYVAYQMSKRPISLVVTSDTVATPSGGEGIVSNGLMFHYDSIDGLKVISWSDKGLTYALVSDLEERGQESCVVCHAGTKDRDFIEGLKPGVSEKKKAPASF